ncbi:histone methyltransferase set1 [Vermiconidia calcicola]|uniref:Histone methyltransferase set1 n=1 Tax=Vermiconidia calcicola TaxID=1690605 RepID=A0ACC3ND83_9PEZI|nr:histone methyltransferase set1 [Vermiconidia calcicola]
MGQDNSRPGPSAAQQTALETPRSPEADTNHGNEDAVGIVSSPPQSAGHYNGRSSVFSSPVNANKNRIPLKRTRDERDEDDYKYYRQRSPPYPQDGDPYHPIPRAPRQPMSPLDTRHTFIPDRTARSSPDRGRRQEGPPCSPRLKGGLRHVDHRSPPLRETFIHLPPDGRRSPRVSQRYRTPKGSSPPARSRRRSSSNDVPRSADITWGANNTHPGRQVDPGHAETPDSNVNGQSSSPIADGPRDQPDGGVRSSFNGLRGVPTRPKARALTDLSKTAKRQPVPVDVGAAVKQHPHIFISTSALPSHRATVIHLYKYLKNRVLCELDVQVDRLGYYITFDDSDAGREDLEYCYSKFHGGIFFNTWTLEMTRYPDGQLPSTSTPTMVLKSARKSAALAPKTPPFDHNARPLAPTKALDEQGRAQSMSDYPAPTDDGLRNRQSNPRAGLNSGLPAGTTVQPTRHSSPLRVPSRQDKDDSSSISSFTDISASKLMKCHTCREAPVSDADVLTQCSSCPRRYHRRCHTQPAIPTDLEHDHAWQCRRCVKKQVRPRSRLSNASPAAVASPAPSVGQREELPAKIPRQESPRSTSAAKFTSNGVEAMMIEAGASCESAANGLSQNGEHEPPVDPPQCTTHTSELLPRDSHVSHVHEADDLVEKSFKLAEAKDVGVHKRSKLGRFSFTRKKISEPRTATATDPSELHQTPDSAVMEEHTIAPDSGAEDGHTDGTPGRKNKPHRWSGGGADRNIIQSGMQTLFSPVRPRRMNEDAAPEIDMLPSVSAEAVVAPPDVPDSPTGAHKAVPRREPGKPSVQPARMDKDVSLDRATPSTDGGLQQWGGSRIEGPAQKMKPSATKTTQCAQCPRTIAVGPLGHKLCTRCRKSQASGEPTMESAPAPAEDGQQLLNGVGPDELGKWNTTDAAAPADPASSVEKQNEGGVFDDGLRTVSTSAGDAPQKAKPHTSCDHCRVHRKRCTHVTLTSAKGAKSKTQPGESANGEGNASTGDRPDQDLNFWTAKPPHSIEETPKRPASALHGASVNEGHVAQSPSLEFPVNEPVATLKKSHSGQRKRQSHTVPAKSEFDIGNSYKRPAGSYSKLIGMAMMSSESRRLTANDVVAWIDDNVPSYNKGEGEGWEKGITATLSMKVEGKSNHSGTKALWRKIEVQDGQSNTLYELLPSVVATTVQWDPVLKEPVSPMKRRLGQTDGARTLNAEAKRAEPQPVFKDVPTIEASRKGGSGGLKRKRRPKPVAPDQMDTDDVNEVAGEAEAAPAAVEQMVPMQAELSSDDEPLANTKRRRIADEPPVPETSLAEQEMDIDTTESVRAMEEDTRTPIPPAEARAACLQPPPDITGQPTLAQMIKMDAENLDCSAVSLFDEWPEYNPATAFDREAKIVEIKKRPTRKERCRKPPPDPWSEWKPQRLIERHDSRASSTSFEHVNRTPRKTALFDVWEGEEGTTKHYDTLEDFFDLPLNPIPILLNREIGYRDGNRDDDGTLRRAKKTYPTGYAC